MDELKRRVLFEETPIGEAHYEQRLRFVLEGMAGAVSASFDIGHHRTSKGPSAQGAEGTAEYHGLGPVSGTHRTEEMMSVEMVFVGAYAHAYRPWADDFGEQLQHECDLLEGARSCYQQEMYPDGGSRFVFGLGNPGGIEHVYAWLHDKYVERFVPESRASTSAERAQAGADAALRRAGVTPGFVEVGWSSPGRDFGGE